MRRRCRSAPSAWRDAVERLSDERGADVTLVRNGSRGLFWLEPLVEVETPHGRVAYRPGRARAMSPALFDAGFLPDAEHTLCLGLTEEIPYLKKQERLTFARCGIIDPLSLDDYVAHGGYRGLAQRARPWTRAAIVEEVTQLRPARPRRRRLPDGHQVADRAEGAGPTRNTSSATPTRATAAPSPTACSWKAIPSC